MNTNQTQTAAKQHRIVQAHIDMASYLDQIDFRRHPYRGILRMVAKQLDYQTTSGLRNAFQNYRNPRALMAVYKAVRKREAEIEEALRCAS